MKIFYSVVALLGLLLHLTACDSQNQSAAVTDSTANTSPVTVGLKFLLPDSLKESSGLCFTDGSLWTFNDGGNANQIYKIDSSTGAILQTVKIENFPNIDWEDMTADSSYLYIGDFGNNQGNRKDLKIIRIKKSDLGSSSAKLSVKGEAIQFSYTDQTDFSPVSSTNFDCESMFSKDHFIYIFSKNGIDFKTRCYRIPDQPGNYPVSPISNFDTQGKVTAAAYNLLTKQIALLGYVEKRDESFIWFLDGYTGDNFFSGSSKRVIVGNLKKWQTEGLAYITNNRLFMNCESTKKQDASLYFVQKN
jgi:hypothetical protein